MCQHLSLVRIMQMLPFDQLNVSRLEPTLTLVRKPIEGIGQKYIHINSNHRIKHKIHNSYSRYVLYNIHKTVTYNHTATVR